MHTWTVVTPSYQRTVDVTADHMHLRNNGRLLFTKDGLVLVAFNEQGWQSVSRAPEVATA